MTSAAVVVVGAGAIGASVAHHLALRGWRDVLVLERGAAPGAGSTSRATGGFRAQFATAIHVRLSLLAREKLLRFAEEIGVDPGYLPAGYLWLASSEPELEALRAALEVQRAQGLVEAGEVSVADAARLNPAVSLDGVRGGAFCPSDGFIRPLALVEGYLAAARQRGVRLECGVEALGLERAADGRIVRVNTTRGPIAVGSVVNAAGPWAAVLAASAGLELPVVPLRRQAALTEPTDRLPAGMPMTIFCSNGFHLRVRDGRVLFCLPSPGAAGRPFDCSVEPEWVDAVAEQVRARVPPLRDVAIDRGACYAGLYEMSPDRHALLGPAPGCANLFLANGSSGHGVMHAPALGQLLAEIMSDGLARTLDTTPLRPSRFAEGAPNPPELL